MTILSTALVVWLLGKTGAGKTAIVATLTGDTRAAVGSSSGTAAFLLREITAD